MSDEPINDPDETRLGELLRTLDADAAPVDRSVIDALRERTLKAFGDSASSEAARDVAARSPDRAAAPTEGLPALSETSGRDGGVVGRPRHNETQLDNEPAAQLARSPSHQRTRHPMITLAIRGAVALAGLAAAIVVGLNLTGHGRLSGAMPFADVLENLRSQKTLELQVTKGKQKAEVWIRAGAGSVARVAAAISNRGRLAAVED